MPRYCFKLKIKPECREEYIAVHRDVDRALIAKYTRCGVRNYSLFMSAAGEVIGCLEVGDWQKFADAVSNSPEQKNWAKKVVKFFLVQPQEPGGMELMPEVFHMD
ncbi:MAG: L-rhamnose mutarotase [Verrucomicrobia bacterium]|nr:L-rhamnose mutarotase [Verrucomicrobiota bacterium]